MRNAAPASLSARRAWIEIAMTSQISVSTVVALRKESVDRNLQELSSSFLDIGSLSARRAWIEISLVSFGACLVWSLSARRAWIEIIFWICRMFRPAVALRKESVDRNLQTFQTALCWLGRSPQGERG